MKVTAIPGASVRIPNPKPGVVTAVHCHREERAVILHPSDFYWLEDVERLVTDLAAFTPIEPSPVAASAHIGSDTPAGPTTDPDTLDELFGARSA